MSDEADTLRAIARALWMCDQGEAGYGCLQAADALDALEAERDRLQNRIKELGDMIHKRGNDIAVLRWENKKLREAIDAIAPWLSASLSPKEEGGLGADAGSKYRAACDKVFRAALKGDNP